MLLAIALAPALAQGFETHHPLVPSAGIAQENGPGALWVNPANMSYDKDFRLGAFYSFAHPPPVAEGEAAGPIAPASLAVTAGVDGLGVGVHNALRQVGDEVLSDVSLDYATSIALPERLAIGLLMSWNFIQDGPNYFEYDAGASWRPLPWIGLGGSAQNIGNPDPNFVARPRSGVGVALRPLGDVIVAGIDYSRLFGAAPRDPNDELGIASVRIRPVEGLYLRGSTTIAVVDTDVVWRGFGAGLEFYFDGQGGGYHADVDEEGGLVHTVSVGTGEPGESLIRAGRQVPTLELVSTPAYQPTPFLFSAPSPGWLDILELMRRVEDDPAAHGFVLALDGPGLSMARCAELRQRIAALEAAGKPVLVVLGDQSTNGEYYAATAASRIALHPAADLDLVGFSVELVHLRGLLDIVGVNPQFVGHGRYKSAPEQFTLGEPSQPSLEQHRELLDDIYNDTADRIAAGRGVDRTIVDGWLDGGPYSAKEALANGLVDVLVYDDQLEGEVDARYGRQATEIDLLTTPQAHSPWEDPDQIAVVYIEGTITSGESSRGGLLSSRSTGSRTTVRQLEQARRDRQVEAVVLRIDSPGGSAFASDEIWREVERLEEQGKPVVASMGGLAASGGYYVAAGADAIFAEPTTITGSIGVFGGKFTTEELFSRVGVTSTAIGRGRNSGIHSGTTPWDDAQRVRMQALVDDTYADFVDRVSRGRGMEPAAVEDVAQGRVWSGQAALERGLVDEIGSLQDAIDDARERAGIPERRKVGIVSYSPAGSMLESLVAPSISGRVAAALVRPHLAAEADAAWLQRQLGPLRSWGVVLEHPETAIWAMDPYVLELSP